MPLGRFIYIYIVRNDIMYRPIIIYSYNVKEHVAIVAKTIEILGLSASNECTSTYYNPNIIFVLRVVLPPYHQL